MPELFPESWEYYVPDPEIAALFTDDSRAGAADLLYSGATCIIADANRKPDTLCSECGDPFVRRGSTLACCSRLCGSNLRERRRARKRIPFRCGGCRRLFISKWSNGKRYCSNSCNPHTHRCGRVTPPEPLAVSLAEGRALIDAGVQFGVVFPLVPSADRDALRSWFACRSESPCSPLSAASSAVSLVTPTGTRTTTDS